MEKDRSVQNVIRILGIDPGTRYVGFGVVEKNANTLRFIAGGCIQACKGEVPQRLVSIYQGLREVITRHSPGTVAVETVFTGNNPKTAVAIGEGRGVALLSAAERGLEVRGYEPALIKRAIAGNGRADKDQVRAMVKVLLTLPSAPETDHEADALALAITHARYLTAREATGNFVPAIRGRGRTGRGPVPEFIARQLPPGTIRGMK